LLHEGLQDGAGIVGRIISGPCSAARRRNFVI
jgi:hypothetical protein